ncbi:MAG: hypothetical protein AB7T31_10660 [Gemmatimonadales bacterium]
MIEDESGDANEGASGPADAPRTRRDFLIRLAKPAAVVAGGFALGLATDELWARSVRGVDLARESYPRAIVGGWRVHHNVVGYVLLAAGWFWRPLLLVPAGIGMIVGHRRRDRLWWFMERVG